MRESGAETCAICWNHLVSRRDKSLPLWPDGAPMKGTWGCPNNVTPVLAVACLLFGRGEFGRVSHFGVTHGMAALAFFASFASFRLLLAWRSYNYSSMRCSVSSQHEHPTALTPRPHQNRSRIRISSLWLKKGRYASKSALSLIQFLLIA